MPKKALTEDELREALANACEAAGGQSAWAAKAGITQQYVSDVLNNKRSPGDSICRALGYERATIYVKKDHWDQYKR